MPVEAELKARVRDPESLLAVLDTRAQRVSAVYRDRYFDSPDGTFTAAGSELRIRTVEANGTVRHLMTFKSPTIDPASGSKPEHETTVGDARAAHAILTGLGYRPLMSFSKHCENFQIHHAHRDMLASVVTVPEIDGTFVEVETIVTGSADDVPAALDAIRALMTDLGIRTSDLTTELYTDAVRTARSG